MKLHLLSDLHLEFGYPLEVPPTDSDVVVLAGDINLGTAGVKWAKATFPDRPVVYAAGNHEFYKHHWIKLLDDLRKEASGSNVHFLENDELVLGDVRFLGCSLWTDFALFGDEKRHWAMTEAAEKMTDYKKIRAPRVKPGFRDDYSKLKPIQTLERFRKSRAFLEESLSRPFDGATVVVTHHLPSRSSLPTRFAESLASAAYASDLTELMQANGPDLWIHGHVHEGSRYKIAETTIVSNPRGYRLAGGSYENPLFDPNFAIEV